MTTQTQNQSSKLEDILGNMQVQYLAAIPFLPEHKQVIIMYPMVLNDVYEGIANKINNFKKDWENVPEDDFSALQYELNYLKKEYEELSTVPIFENNEKVLALSKEKIAEIDEYLAVITPKVKTTITEEEYNNQFREYLRSRKDLLEIFGEKILDF